MSHSDHRVAWNVASNVRPGLPPLRTLSASVEREPADDAACPHFQSVISGMSSPYRSMYSLCSISLSRIACFA